MDILKWDIDGRDRIQKKCKHLTGRLQAARNKLTPIVDDIISSAVDLIQKGDNNFFNEATLTTEQYRDVIWASDVMKEILYQFNMNPTDNRWPNTDVIVNNVSVEYQNRVSSSKGKSIVIDEVTVVQLLQLYDEMGQVIKKISEEANQQNELQARDNTGSNVKKLSSAKSIKSEKSGNPTSEKQLRTTPSLEKVDDFPPQIKSTLSVIQKSSSGELNKKHGVRYSDTPGNRSCGENTKVLIRIQCVSDCTDGEPDENFRATSASLPANCDQQTSPHHHLRLGGEPVILKVDQANAEKGAIYCINAGTDGDGSDIKIFIKQCPECFSTVISSTTKIQDVSGESHESITLHGKGPSNESQMAYSSDDTVDGKHESHRSVARDHSKKSATKMDVLIDAENVDKSAVKFTGQASEESVFSGPKFTSSPTSVGKMPPSLEVIHSSSMKEPSRQKSLVPLMRTRICSSMEFDVTTVNTRLREHEIEHDNPHIVVELKEMGVDHLLTACRPAKCCRKAILDERQRTGLPYCVSLRSLPLMGNDIEIIKQSHDMSVKKIKNAVDLTQKQKDKMAYYVSLGRDDFKPNLHFPWVIPVYDVKQSVLSNRGSDIEKFYILKNSEDLLYRRAKSMSNALKPFKDKQKQQKRKANNTQRKIRTERYFVLKRLKEKAPPHVSDTDSQIMPKKKCAKQHIRRRNRMKPKEFVKAGGDKNYINKIVEWNRSRDRKDLKHFGNVDHGDHVLFFGSRNKKEFYDEKRGSSINLDDIIFNFERKMSTLKYNSRSESDVSLSRLIDFEFRSNDKDAEKSSKQLQHFMETEDSYMPMDEMLGMFLGGLNRIKYSFQIAPKKSFSDTHLITKSGSRLTNSDSSNYRLTNSHSLNYWDHFSEELFYASSLFTIFMKRTRSVGRIPKPNQNSYCEQIESEISSYVDATRLEDEKETKSPEVKKKLEYYVGLINGNLVWSQSLPLTPQKYDTYYNYSDSEPVKFRPRNRQNESTFRHRDTIDEIPPQDYGNQDHGDPRPISVNLVESESPDSEWAPFLISEHSLPVLPVVEEVKKVEQAPVEAPKAQPEPPPKKECHKKETCKDNKCKTCTAKTCERIKTKSHGQGNIVIDIQKTKSKSNSQCLNNPTETKRCNKEICELYKNKALMPDNREKARSSKQPSDPCDKKNLRIKAKDNIQIVIKDRKISVVNEGKKSKERKEKR